jgi:hypothetical protein
MTWQLTADVEEFLTAAGETLRRDRVRNTTLLTVAETVRIKGGPALFGWSGPPRWMTR